jgi:hypothetical protein
VSLGVDRYKFNVIVHFCNKIASKERKVCMPATEIKDKKQRWEKAIVTYLTHGCAREGDDLRVF